MRPQTIVLSRSEFSTDVSLNTDFSVLNRIILLWSINAITEPTVEIDIRHIWSVFVLMGTLGTYSILFKDNSNCPTYDSRPSSAQSVFYKTRNAIKSE